MRRASGRSPFVLKALMDINLFKIIARHDRPSQNIVEWQMFLEWVDSYFKNRRINRPVVVELGTWFNRQKKYYEQLLNAVHVGIDDQKDERFPEKMKQQCRPDILGNTHDANTVQKLKIVLEGRPINLLFIDAGHNYKDVKRDFEIYEPLTKNIVAIHDIMLDREEVRLFWNEICHHKDYITCTIHAPSKYHAERISVGTGLIIKEW